ncbi:uncharacterized protein LOC129787363 [Lutzomyia longipalpis]|uniref:uncharacterized protein LOC129787363 n=1 Tax=Lutzomyia longipalpis TaxID=7200 RepID=UPI0024838BFB|nr:uncharacterized protein LOC129787363 [Lutzomyia longipalpis]
MINMSIQEGISDLIITEEEAGYDVPEFEILPDAIRGPEVPYLKHLKAELEETRKILSRESGSLERHTEKAVNHPDFEKTKQTEKEIKRYLNMYENELAYRGSTKPMKTSPEVEVEDMTMNKNLPIFLGRQYFKFQPSSDSDESSSIKTSTTSDEITTEQPRQDLYCNFSTGQFNYSFPFQY